MNWNNLPANRLMNLCILQSESGTPEDELEMDELNRHECMPVMVSLLKHMKEAGVYKPPKEVQNQSYLD